MKKTFTILVTHFLFGQIANCQTLDKFVYTNIGMDKADIIEKWGGNYSSLPSDEGVIIIYMNVNAKGLNPTKKGFIFPLNNNLCKGVALYFDYSQLNYVINFMNKTFEAKSPPNGLKVSFYKAWMEYENGIRYVWKLVKTDNLFFLTIDAR